MFHRVGWNRILNLLLLTINLAEMGIQRILSRGLMMLAVVCVAETVPNFGVLLDLVGGSTITLMSLIFPIVFNLFLMAACKKHGNDLAALNETPLSIKELVGSNSKQPY